MALVHKVIHHTMGVYASGFRKHNGVHPDDLQAHIQYNQEMRPGRALFVDGKCVHQGYLTREECDTIEREYAAHPHKMRSITRPYR